MDMRTLADFALGREKLSAISTYTPLLILFWTLSVGASLAYNIIRTYDHAEEHARILARTAFEKDIMYRRWNASLGGVYVPVTDKTPPNPHLAHDPNHIIPGPDGTLLTKLNPAYMTRLVHDIGETQSGMRGRITSTNPIRPENMAEPWEAEALKRIDSENIPELAELQHIDGEEYLRFIAPLKTEENCLSCHAGQGYKLGDQRGGISISVPYAHIADTASSAVTGLTLSHAAMWLMGVSLFLVCGTRLSGQIRKRAEAEDELGCLMGELEQRVADRTQDLRASMEAAKQASKAKSDFLANISHEVRTPLNGVLGMTELLMRTRLDEQQASMAATIKTAGANLLTVINDILDFSKIEAGKMILDPQPFSLRDMVFDVMKSLAPIAFKKKLEMIVNIAPQTPDAVIGDSLRIHQVLLNLVGNAIKFTNMGEVILTVSVLDMRNDGAKLRFSVADTGIGIAADKQECIFSAFEQADTSTTRKFGGTGLGLAISHRLVSLMGGKLQLESLVGQGSTFRFDIDLPFTDDLPPQKPALSAQALQGMHVLIVDDNATNRSILLEQLLDWGMSPVESTCVDEALRLLRVGANSFAPFAMVLSDLQMPDKDGIELIKAMRAESALSDIPVILLSSGELPADTPSSLYTANLTKPVRPAELLCAMSTAAGVWESFDLDHLQGQARDDAKRVSGVRLHVLLVEDMEMNQLVAVRMLKNLGHVSAVACNGQQALDMLSRENFDIVFMDIQMPVMDGLRALAAIRDREAAEGKGSHIPVVALTANALKGDKERYLEAGMDAYIAKPITLSVLAMVIDDLVQRFKLAQRKDPPSDEADVPDPVHYPGGELPAPIEPGVLQRSFSGDVELARQSMEIYLGDAPGLLEEILSAIAEGDNKKLTVSAHSLKGLTGYYTRGPVYDSCLTLERKGRENALPAGEAECMRIAADLKKQADALMRAMRAYIVG